MLRWILKLVLAIACGVAPIWGSAQPANWGPGGTITCATQTDGENECRTGFRGPAVLVRNLSGVRCIEGRNWGNREAGRIWVSEGCRGEFAEARGGNWSGPGTGQVVRCESTNGRYRECRLNDRGAVGLVRQLSDSPCIQGRSWGQRGNMVWVDGGCRAEFATGAGSAGPGGWGGAGGYSVTCSSNNEQAAFCSWDFRRGYPRVIEQLSSARCEEGRSWGLRGRGQIWVSHGCRARFGVR